MNASCYRIVIAPIAGAVEAGNKLFHPKLALGSTSTWGILSHHWQTTGEWTWPECACQWLSCLYKFVMNLSVPFTSKTVAAAVCTGSSMRCAGDGQVFSLADWHHPCCHILLASCWRYARSSSLPSRTHSCAPCAPLLGALCFFSLILHSPNPAELRSLFYLGFNLI